MKRSLSSEDLDLSGQFFLISCRQTTTTTTAQRLLLITTTTLVVLMMSSSSSSTASTAILPPHVLLKPNADEGPRAGTGGTGSQTGRRRLGPSPWRLTVSDDLPPRPPLPGFADKDSLPTRADRDPRVLAAILGDDFDGSFMSIGRPEDSVKHPNGTLFYTYAAIENISTSFRFPKLDRFPGGGRRLAKFGGGKRQRMLLRTYLAAYIYCPVHRRWLDLGRTFWPRWIRQGDCSRGRSGGGGGGGARSCSFPPGMSCKPERSTSKRVLWWHCQSQGRCQWIRIVYPVVTACRCSC